MAKGSYGKRLKFEVILNLELLRLINTDPRLKVRTMHYVSRYGLVLLKTRFLKQKGPHSLKMLGDIGGRRGPVRWRHKGKKGVSTGRKSRYKVKATVMKDMNSVYFRSHILNLFEYGRRYKGTGVGTSRFARKRHVQEPGKFILTVHFKNALNAKIAAFAEIGMDKAVKQFAKEAEGKGKKL